MTVTRLCPSITTRFARPRSLINIMGAGPTGRHGDQAVRTGDVQLTYSLRPSVTVAAGTRSGVRVRAGILAAHARAESVEVEVPALAVVIPLSGIGQVVVTQDDAGAAVLGLQRDHHTRGARTDLVIVGPAPGENEPMRRVDLDEFADSLDAVADVHAIAATRHSLERGVAAHPPDVPAGVGEVGKHDLGLSCYMNAHLDDVTLGHVRSRSRCSASARSLTQPRLCLQ